VLRVDTEGASGDGNEGVGGGVRVRVNFVVAGRGKGRSLIGLRGRPWGGRGVDRGVGNA